MKQASAQMSPDLFVVLPKTFAASPNAASDGPVRVTRAAAPASRLSAARLLTACVHPGTWIDDSRGMCTASASGISAVSELLRHSPRLAAEP